jgi:hypothetical protein
VAAVVLVVDGGVAAAAPSYQLLSLDAQNAPLPGTTSSVSASSDGRIVAFAGQTADAGCAASTVFIRDRQAGTSTPIGTGLLPAVTGDGAKVAFESCDPAPAPPKLVLWSAGAVTTVATAAQWTQGSADTVKSVAVSPSGTVIAFTVGPVAGLATKLFLGHDNGTAPTPVATAQGAEISTIDVAKDLVAFVAGGRAFTAPTAQPGTPTAVDFPGGAISAFAVSDDHQTMAVANGDGVYVKVGAPAASLLTAGALEPSMAPDGSAVAVTMSSPRGINVYSPTKALLSAATPVADGTFNAPVVANGGREVVFLATGAAAGGTGAGVQAFGFGPGLSASATAFGDVGVGTTTTKAITFTNNGTADITPATVTSSNSEFAVLTNGTTCGQPVKVGGSCVVQVALTPVAAGARTAVLTITQQGGQWDASPVTASLSATGVNGELSAEPSTLEFGSVTVGSTSSARTFTVTNSGGLPTTIGTLLVSGGQASEFPLAGGTCAGATLAPAATCTVSVSFKPGGTGAREASMDVGGSSGAAVSVALTGTGSDPPRPALAATPTALDFGEQIIGSAGAPQTITVRNTGNVANTPSVQVTGTAAADFAIASNGCSRSLSAGSSCTVSVSFNPTVSGTRVATLSVSGSGGSSASVRLSGTARLNPVLAASPPVIVPGQVVTITGSNFPAGAAVVLSWDVGGAAASTVADANGSFSVAAVVPAGGGSGTRRILVASPPDAASATAAVLVQQPMSAGGPGSPVFTNSPVFRRS